LSFAALLPPKKTKKRGRDAPVYDLMLAIANDPCGIAIVSDSEIKGKKILKD
jgi:hypothetical protein